MTRTKLTVGLGAAGLVTLLTACSAAPTPGPSESAPAELTPVRFALDWTPNTNHTGAFVAAEKGYFEEAGLDVEILPYNSTFADTLVDSGNAECGISAQGLSTFAQLTGADLISVMAVLQTNSTAIGVSAARDDIQSPADLDGKIYAGFGIPTEGPTLARAIQTAGGEGVFDSVTLGTTAYEALYSGTADFTIPFVAWEGIEAEHRGEPFKYFKFTDYGVPDEYSIVVNCNRTWLEENPEVAKSFIQALAHGYEDGVEDPDGSAQILIDANADFFTEPDFVIESQEMLADQFMLDADGAFGLQTEAQWAALGEFFFDSGLLVDADGEPVTEMPDWSTFFTNEYLE